MLFGTQPLPDSNRGCICCIPLARPSLLRVGYLLTLLATWPTTSLIAAELTIQAESCAFSSVQDAVTSGSADMVVNIPAGTCDWGANTLTIPGGISLRGGGVTATIIRGSLGTGDLITIDCSNGKTSTVSDMTLIGKANPAIWDGGLSLINGCKDFLVFNARFRDFVNRGISVRGDARGVIFRNEFVNNFRAGQRRGTTGYGVVVYGDGTWPPLELGTANAVFVEDNVFIGNRHHIASNNGSRYVFRHNTVTGTKPVKNFSMVDAHGFASALRGSRSWEIYDNTFSTNLPPGITARTAIGIAGGDGVIFNNVLATPHTIKKTIELWAPSKTPIYPAKDQMTAGYFWSNSPNIIINQAPRNFVEGREYFLHAPTNYTPYPYPHPLRSTQTLAPRQPLSSPHLEVSSLAGCGETRVSS